MNLEIHVVAEGVDERILLYTCWSTVEQCMERVDHQNWTLNPNNEAVHVKKVVDIADNTFHFSLPKHQISELAGWVSAISSTCVAHRAARFPSPLRTWPVIGVEVQYSQRVIVE